MEKQRLTIKLWFFNNVSSKQAEGGPSDTATQDYQLAGRRDSKTEVGTTYYP